jgi:hypothetical protein
VASKTIAAIIDARTFLSFITAPELLARTVIRPHGEEARALRRSLCSPVALRARAVSNHEGGPCVSTSSFETHRTVGKCRLCDAPQDEVDRQRPTILQLATYLFRLLEMQHIWLNAL